MPVEEERRRVASPGRRATRFGRSGIARDEKRLDPALAEQRATNSRHGRSFPGGFEVSNRSSARRSSNGVDGAVGSVDLLSDLRRCHRTHVQPGR